MTTPKGIIAQIVLAAGLFVPALATANPTDAHTSTARTPMMEDKDGILAENEFEKISTNDSIYRARCPYTCEMRGVPKEHCRTWQSKQDQSMCYVQDTRLPSDAIGLK